MKKNHAEIDKKNAQKGESSQKNEERQSRLAQKLRENLKKRKQQQRARTDS